MRKIKQFLLTTAVLIASTAVTMAAYSGTPATPSVISGGDFDGYYAIGTAEELYGFAELVNGGTTSAKAVLTADIVVNENVLNADGTLNGTPSYSWKPIGTSSKSYAGTFDGNGHTISGLYFSNNTDKNYPEGGNYVGLFGYVYNGTIKKVGIVDSYIYGHKYNGGICGYNNGGTIEYCFNSGRIVCGYWYAGGICGSSSGKVLYCYNTGKVSAIQAYGGIAGQSYSGISYCYCLSGSSSNVGGGKFATAEEFASGKITYLLNEEISGGDVWRQNLGTDGDLFPTFDNTHNKVYSPSPCHNREEYANTPINQEHAECNGIGMCTVCGKYAGSVPSIVDGVYEISNAEQLYWFAEQVNSGNTGINVKLIDDIVVNENVLTAEGTLNGTPKYDWPATGTTVYPYKGVFDGNGHTISGLKGNCLINRVEDGVIKNVGVIDSYYSGICNYASGYTTISNCFHTGTAKGYSGVGGICCTLGENGIITNCFNTGIVEGSCDSGDSNVGGICGKAFQPSKIINCYNTGKVTSKGDAVGGICGYTYNRYSSGLVEITNCYNTGIVSGAKWYYGGIYGYYYNYSPTITNCYRLQDNGNSGGNIVTTTQFESGEVTYLLNGRTSDGDLTWRQNLPGDATPSLDKSHKIVYLYSPCPAYGNEQGENPHSFDELGYCSKCLHYAASGTLITEENYGDFEGLTSDHIGYFAIANAAQLYWFADTVNTEINNARNINAVLVADIVVNENVLADDGTLNGDGSNFKVWTPIGKDSWPYSGTFDGNHHTVSGLYCNSQNDEVGFFSESQSGGSIKNLGIVDSYIKGKRYVGGICGYGGLAKISNCYNAGTIEGTTNVGGICGAYPCITDCYNVGKIIGDGSTGGICSYGSEAYYYIKNSYNAGTIVGGGDGIGIRESSRVTVTNCYCLEGSAETVERGVFVTAEELSSGKIAYLLNEKTSGGDVWRQNLESDKDLMPTLNKNHGKVYTKIPCPTVFANEDNLSNPHHYDSKGFCSCGGCQPATLVNGTYQIANNGQLCWFAEQVNSGNVRINGVLTADIMINENVLTSEGELNEDGIFTEWTPIGTSDKKYTGIFDGNGHTISGLYYNNQNVSSVGLFGYVNGGTIKNVRLIDSYVYGYSRVGGICGNGANNYVSSAIIMNCYNEGTIICNYNGVGGICGEYGIISNCVNTGIIKNIGGNYAGGICGFRCGATNCYNAGQIYGSYGVGGICGAAEWNQSITNCYNVGTVTGSYTCGGICATTDNYTQVRNFII